MLKRVNHQFLVSIVLFLVSVCILLWDSRDLFKSEPAAVGFAENHGKELSLRLDGDIAWTKVSGQTKIHSGDRIYTSENSVANLDFFDSFSLKLNELTLIKVSSNKKGQSEIDVGQGSFTLDLKNNSKGVVLRIGKKEVKLTGADSSVGVIRKNDEVSLVVNRGTVEIGKVEETANTTGAEESHLVSAGESLSLNENIIVPQKACDQYISPINQTEIIQEKNRVIYFSWLNHCPQREGTFELASDAQFENVFYSTVVHGVRKGVLIPPEKNGLIFWRIKRKDQVTFPQSFVRTLRNNPAPATPPAPLAKTKNAVKRTPSNDLSPMFVEVKKKERVKETAPIPTPAPTPTVKVAVEDPAEKSEDLGEIVEKIKHKLFFGFGMGLTSSSYKDSLVSVNQYSMTPKVVMSYRFTDRVRVVLNSFFTAIPLNSNVVKTDPIANPATTDTVTVRYLGINARASYLTPWLHDGWRLELSGGWYFNSTFVTNNYFGYKNISGPQIYPSIEKDFKNASTIGGYFKYSPVSSGATFLNISSNYEIALGTYYLFSQAEEAHQRWGLSFDYAHLSLLPAGSPISSDTFSLGLSLLFL